MADVAERIACKWCHAQSPSTARSCDRCGAPLDVANLVTDSGWRQAPRLRDLTEIRFGDSVVQLDGTVTPVADVELAAGSAIFFEHHVMLWKDDAVAMSVMDAPGGMKRVFAGLPFVLSVAHGPGRVSFSRDAPGELVVLPVDPGVELDVREHGMIMATANLTYSYEKLSGLKATLAAGGGMYLDRFVSQADQGLLVLHGYGNVMQRELGPDEPIQVEPGGFLYKDSSVRMETVTHKLHPDDGGATSAVKGIAGRGLAGIKAARALKKQGIGGLLSGDVMQSAAGMLTGPGITLMRLIGPGRVGIQSMYQDHETA